MQQHRSMQESPNDAEARPSAPRRERGLGASGRATLAEVLVREVVPRLGTGMPFALDATHVDRLVALCLAQDEHEAAAYVASMQARGVAVEALYDSLLTPAARILGEMWVADLCTFADVTVGTLRLQTAQRALSASFVPAAPLSGRRILLMPSPGEQHAFGLSMVVDHFRRNRWDAHLVMPSTPVRAESLVRREKPDVVGLSLACSDRVEPAAALVRRFRAARRGVVVLAGGALFLNEPGDDAAAKLAARIGVDGIAADAQTAVRIAEEHMVSKGARV